MLDQKLLVITVCLIKALLEFKGYYEWLDKNVPKYHILLVENWIAFLKSWTIWNVPTVFSTIQQIEYKCDQTIIPNDVSQSDLKEQPLTETESMSFTNARNFLKHFIK